MKIFTKQMMKQNKWDWGTFKKKVTTKAIRINGPFETETREGTLSCPDGYLALDSDGWPYPIAKVEFEKIYEQI